MKKKVNISILTVGSVPRTMTRIVPKLRHFHWLLKMNNQLNLRNLGTILRASDPTVSAGLQIDRIVYDLIVEESSDAAAVNKQS